MDETFIGGQEPGLRGGRAKGKKVLNGIAAGSLESLGHRPTYSGETPSID